MPNMKKHIESGVKLTPLSEATTERNSSYKRDAVVSLFMAPLGPGNRCVQRTELGAGSLKVFWYSYFPAVFEAILGDV